jgi:hypothetical protein
VHPQTLWLLTLSRASGAKLLLGIGNADTKMLNGNANMQ